MGSILVDGIDFVVSEVHHGCILGLDAEVFHVKAGVGQKLINVVIAVQLEAVLQTLCIWQRNNKLLLKHIGFQVCKHHDDEKGVGELLIVSEVHLNPHSLVLDLSGGCFSLVVVELLQVYLAVGLLSVEKYELALQPNLVRASLGDLGSSEAEVAEV